MSKDAEKDSQQNPKQYTDRDIVLEFFPATQKQLIPSSQPYRFVRSKKGTLLIEEIQPTELLEPVTEATITEPTVTEAPITGPKAKIIAELFPIATHGASTTQVCCDLCKRSAPRSHVQMFRLEMPNSDGRLFKYLSVCRQDHVCAAGYMDNDHLRSLVEAVLKLA